MQDYSLSKLFQQFSQQYPYILTEDLIDYFSIFGGLEEIELELYNGLDDAIRELLKSQSIKNNLPFYLFDNPFKKFLVLLARGDGKMYSLFKRLKISEHLGLEITNELIKSRIIYKVESREVTLKTHPKQMIKKELRDYKIEPKLYFTTPFYRFWFLLIEPFITQNRNADIKRVLESVHRYRYKLSSSIFEHLSRELLREDFEHKDRIIECGSLWNRFSEFDLYCKTAASRYIIGECKYKNRPLVKAELVKLWSKVEQSSLNIDFFALFSKSGFSKELYKLEDNRVILFELSDFKRVFLAAPIV